VDNCRHIDNSLGTGDGEQLHDGRLYSHPADHCHYRCAAQSHFGAQSRLVNCFRTSWRFYPPKIKLTRRQTMNQKAHHVNFPVTIVVAMVAFLSIFLFANADNSFAASGKKNSAAVARLTAVEHTEARIKELKSALKITEAQEVLWTNFTRVMRENAKEMDALTKDKADNAKTMNAVERMKFHSQITESRLAQEKRLIPPFEALYAGMSDEQKKTTDTIFLTGRHGKHEFK
jgi:hypothetical protein